MVEPSNTALASAGSGNRDDRGVDSGESRSDGLGRGESPFFIRERGFLRPGNLFLDQVELFELAVDDGVGVQSQPLV